MTHLAPSFLGKNVFMDGEKQQRYVVKYEDGAGKKTIDVLLFDQDTPVIFAVLDYDGRFLDSFFLSNRTTKASGEALAKYEEIQGRKKQHKVTQDDLKDALKPESQAKMKNKNIQKLLRDEFLEDIKHHWPSRLITLQREENGASDSLIMEALDEAVEKANPKKAYDFIRSHRLDDFLPKLGLEVPEHPEMLEKAAEDFFYEGKGKPLHGYLYHAAVALPTDRTETVEQLLVRAEQLDREHGTNGLKRLLTIFSKKLKEEDNGPMTEWLKEVTVDPQLRQSVVQAIKKS
ncbi:hypothetical protein [Alkalicoccus chagannorensis]|uniref:hypothetical protein n=1 Tax=Alkalicoccus chagannorensis TaxID=427072 RepID=UPI00041788DA|nr:hypothetical protein [Alkalicoccus chagannorensis]